MGGGSVHCESCDHQALEQHDRYHFYSIQGATAQNYEPMQQEGELVTVYTEANPNYRLTARGDEAALAVRDSRDTKQQWIKVDVGTGNGGFFDREGQPGFVLVNKASGLPLKHGYEVKDVVATHPKRYTRSALEGSIIWSLGKKDEGRGYKGLRAVTNIKLNLEADLPDGDPVVDGSILFISQWKPQANFKWKVEPLEPLISE